MVAEPLRLVEEGKDEGAPAPSLVLAFNEVVVKRETIIINGHEYQAFVWNKRILRSVRAQVFDAYLEARSDDNRRQYKSQLAQANCQTKVLMAMIPGLSYTEADALNDEEVGKIELRLGLREDIQGEPNPPPSRMRSGSTRPTGARSSSNSTPPSD